ncbi:MAG: hypothetical protein U5J96_11115, partial [Ignavibacteriaceae bacterium]|nr:hypothetical protein [Ignavibacteriaceae bacterium]
YGINLRVAGILKKHSPGEVGIKTRLMLSFRACPSAIGGTRNPVKKLIDSGSSLPALPAGGRSTGMTVMFNT